MHSVAELRLSKGWSADSVVLFEDCEVLRSEGLLVERHFVKETDFAVGRNLVYLPVNDP
jgi:hypothetical protein